jgi:hypothetical protein
MVKSTDYEAFHYTVFSGLLLFSHLQIEIISSAHCPQTSSSLRVRDQISYSCKTNVDLQFGVRLVLIKKEGKEF